MFETGLLKDKRILVTGGGSGLGAAMAHRFLALGAEVVICGRKLDRLEAAARGMREETGGKGTTIACDIRDGTAVESMMDAVWREAPLDSRQQRGGDFHCAERISLIPRGGCDPRADAAWYDVLHACRRQALDRRQAWRRRAFDPLDLDHH